MNDQAAKATPLGYTWKCFICFTDVGDTREEAVKHLREVHHAE